MKTTHTLHDVEGMILDRLAKLRDSKDKKEQTKLNKEIAKLEKHFNDCNEKNINGKKYPDRSKPKPVSKEELLKLIDDIDTIDPEGFNQQTLKPNSYVDLGVDVSGVFTKGALEE